MKGYSYNISLQKTISDTKLEIDLDSLANSINYEEISSEKIEGYIKDEINNTNYNLAIAYSNLYLKKGEKKEDKNISFKFYYYKAYIYYLQNKTSEVPINVDNAMKFLPEENQKSNALRVLLLKGSAYMSLSDYENAMIAYVEADSYLDNTEINENKISISLNIAQCKIRLKRYQDALQDLLHLQKSIEDESIISTLTKYNQTAIPFATYNAIGICHGELGSYEKAINTFLENLDRISNNNKKHLAITYLNLGEVYHAMKDYEKAEENVQSSKNLFVQLDDKSENFVLANYLLADCFFRKANYAEAKIYIDENVIVIEKNKKIEKGVEIIELAIKNAEHLNDPKSEMNYRKLLASIQKELYTDRNKAKDLLFDKQIDELKGDNEKLFFDNKKNQVYIRFIIIGVLLVSFFLLLYSRRQKKKNKILFDKFVEQSKKSEDKSIKPKTTIKDTSNTVITDEKALNILNKLSALEMSFFYVDKECSLHSTAQQLHTNTSYLSKIINQYKDQNFSNYINDLRISYAIKQLNNSKKYRSYSVKGISQDLGYKSVNTFNNAFKKVTNLSPSFYLKQIKQKVSSNV